jgi:hypothetical protein
MEEFEIEVKREIDEVISSIHALMYGVNAHFLETIIGIFHRKIIKHPYYIRWFVKKIFDYEILTSSKITKLLEENKFKITQENVLGYYRYEIQYELKRNKSIIAKNINDLNSIQKKLNEFIKDYYKNYNYYYGSKLADVLDKEDLFNYIQEFLRI